MGEHADDALNAAYDEELQAICDDSNINAGLPRRETPHHASQNNGPLLVWPNMAFLCHPDLAWIVRNQKAIVDLRRARPMTKVRPVKAWPNGRVRIEFVGNWNSAREARAELEPLLASASSRSTAPSQSPCPSTPT